VAYFYVLSRRLRGRTKDTYMKRTQDMQYPGRDSRSANGSNAMFGQIPLCLLGYSTSLYKLLRLCRVNGCLVE
jgi:hypothetical protein